MITEERREVGIDRVPVRRPVAICAGREGLVFRGETRDLSPRGMAVEVDGALNRGEHLVFKLDLGPDFSTVVEGGEVTWSAAAAGATTAGVRFIPLPKRPATGQLDAVEPASAPSFQPGEELRVKVGGMGQALRAEFVDQASNLLRFRCPLPFLKLRSPVVIRSAQGTDAVFEGEVGSVEAAAEEAEGVPALLVTVWAGAADGGGDAVVLGSVEAAGLSTPPPRAMLSRDTLRDMTPPGDPSVSEPRDTQPDPEPVVRKARPAMPAPEPRPEPKVVVQAEAEANPEPVEPLVGRRIGGVLADAGRKSVTAAAGAARGVGGRVGPLLVKLGTVLFGLLRGLVGGVFGVVGGAHRKWRRSHLPRTYSDVVGRAQRPAVPRMAWIHRAAIGMGVIGVGLAVWGIVGSRDASGRTTGERAADPAAQAPDGAVPTEALPEIPSAWPSAGELPGPSAEPTSPVSEASGAPSDGAAGEAVRAVLPPPREAGGPARAAAPAERGVPAAAPAARPGRRADRGGAAGAPAALDGGRTFVIRLDQPALRIADYGLRQPPGIVLDVLGAGPEGGATRIETGSNQVKLVKAAPREDGTRFIIYLRSRAMPRYTITPNGTEIQVTILE